MIINVNMNRNNVLRNYVLSRAIEEKLNVIKEELKDNVLEADPSWKTIIGKKEEICESEEEPIDDSNSDIEETSCRLSNNQYLFTQFYCTQSEKNFEKESMGIAIQKSDIIECILEDLERPTGRLDFSQLENISDDDLIEVVIDLEKKISTTGIYNLCFSMNSMTLEQRMKHAAILYSHLLLPKIIALEQPSRLLLSIITELVQKFPDDIEKFIFIPLLNINLKNSFIVNAIANSFEPQRNNVLVTEYLLHVKELKSWHLPILQNFLSTKTDQVTNDKFIHLLSEKALDFAKDKHFGKLVLLFVKINTNLTDEQKQLLSEIIEVNETPFKKPILNMLKVL